VKYNYRKEAKVMKVVFVEDVPKVARAGETREVADGYARNYLIPQKLALPLSSAVTGIVEAQRRRKDKAVAESAGLAGQLEGKEVVLKARAGAKERLHGSITSADIAAELENSTGIVVDKRKIELAEPIHQLGSYEVTIRLAKDITPKIKVTVTEEGVV
jgi:large subunit ribosomal protein L9